MRYTVVIPVLNQLRYTQQCVAEPAGARHAGRVDPRHRQRQQRRHAGVARRAAARSARCATRSTSAAAAPGPRAPARRRATGSCCSTTTSLVSERRDRRDARRRRAAALEVVSPALAEGALDYDFEAHRPRSSQAMTGTLRRAGSTASASPCAARVFEAIGFPDTDRRLGGREDVEYLRPLPAPRLPVGTVGDAVFHHFGSITQNAMKQETGLEVRRRSPLLLRQARHRLVGPASAPRPSASAQARALGPRRARAHTATRCTWCAPRRLARRDLSLSPIFKRR